MIPICRYFKYNMYLCIVIATVAVANSEFNFLITIKVIYYGLRNF